MTADVVVVVGTSLQVYPAAGLLRYAKAECDLHYIYPAPKLDEVSDYFNIIPKVATEGMKELYSILTKQK
jgi:NAD-dependent deacetylase